MNFLLALWYGKLINLAVSIIDKSRGSNLAGEKAMRLDPEMISHFKGIDPARTLFITGTNGKSTTTNLIVHVFRKNGKRVVSNLEGANLTHGICTALIKAASITGRIDTDYVILETDERYLKFIRQQLPAENIMMTNFQKDQAQRNGEPGFVMQKIKDAVDVAPVRVFVNNEEPRAMYFSEFAKDTVTFSVDRHSLSYEKDDSYPTLPCPRCQHKVTFEYFNNDYIGKFHCENCGFSGRETGDYTVTGADFHNNVFTVNGVDFSLPYNPPYMLYNAAAACAAAKEIGGIELEDTAGSFKSFVNIAGRFETVEYKGKRINYMRFKQENPETLQTFLNTVGAAPGKKMVALGLDPIEDETPYFLETFYAFDCDFSPIDVPEVEKILCLSDHVCYDTANRLIYQGIDPSKIVTVDSKEPQVILDEISKVDVEDVYLVTRLATYEDMKKLAEKEEGNE